MTLIALLGWSGVLVLGAVTLMMRQRLELVARAEHELRGPFAALSLGVEKVRRGHCGAELAIVLEAQLERASAGLFDLHAARAGTRGSARREPVQLETEVRATVAGWEPVVSRLGRSLRIDWRAGEARVAADRGRLAQALGNLIANAVEHGGGEIELRGLRVGRSVRVEVVDAGGAVASGRGDTALVLPSRRRLRSRSSDRGRGLAIATRAARDAGGKLELSSGSGGTTAVIELPSDEP